MAQSVSLRYISSMHLHKLDELVTKYQKTRYDLLLAMDKLNTITSQTSSMQKRNDMMSNRGASPSNTFSRAIEQMNERKCAAVQDVQDVLDLLSTIAGSASALCANMSTVVGQIGSDSFLHEYSAQVGSATFNDEYREWQRAVDIVADQAKLLGADIKVKMMQFTHCPETQYVRLYKTWSSAQPTKDDAMDDLAAMMIS